MFGHKSCRIVKLNPQVYIANKDNTSLSDKVKVIVSKIAKRTEDELSDTYYYRDIKETIRHKETNLCTDEVTFKISPDGYEDGKHRLEMFVKARGLQTVKSLAYGDKKAILEALSSENLCNDIMQKIQKISDKFSTMPPY